MTITSSSTVKSIFNWLTCLPLKGNGEWGMAGSLCLHARVQPSPTPAAVTALWCCVTSRAGVLFLRLRWPLQTLIRSLFLSAALLVSMQGQAVSGRLVLWKAPCGGLRTEAGCQQPLEELGGGSSSASQVFRDVAPADTLTTDF